MDEQNVCDVPEVCDGHSKECPPDHSKSDGTACVDGDVCTLEDKCTAGKCSGSRVCSVEIETLQALTVKKAQQGKPAFVVTCSRTADNAAGGTCRAQVVALQPGQVGHEGCDPTMALTQAKEVGFDNMGKAIIRLKLDRFNTASKQALKKLAQMQDVPVKVCVRLPIPRPQGAATTIEKEQCATLLSRCPAQLRLRRPSRSICAIELDHVVPCSS